MKVRLYHLAHEWNLSSTSILETLLEAGHRLKSHFVEIDEDEIQDLRDLLTHAGMFDTDEPEEDVEGEGVEAGEATENAVAVATDPESAPPAEEPAVAAEPVAAVEAEPAVVEPAKEPAKAPEPAVAAEAAPVVEAPAEEPKAVEPKPAETKPAEAAKPAEPAKPAPMTADAAATTPTVAKKTVPKVSADKATTVGPTAAAARGSGRLRKPGAPPIPGAPAGVASGFRGFAPGFDPNARRPRRTSRSDGPSSGGPNRSGPGGPPLDPTATPGTADGRGGTKKGSRQAVSPTKRGKQTTRRAGGGGGMGRGRRLERRMQERERWIKGPRKKNRGPRRNQVNVVRPEAADVQLPISFKDLSAILAIRVKDLLRFLDKQGADIDDEEPVPVEAIEAVGLNWNIDITIKDEVKAEDVVTAMDKEEDVDKDLVPRQPVVAVLGHVDHGKTSLLDYIRKTRKPITAGEAGGITQHIGAYVAEHNKKKITFIDTPGHAAFTEMRIRGAKVTDIVLLVIAADDGVMPQTKEAIQHAQAAGTHVIVAANKIDKAGVTIDKVLQDLSQIEGMLPASYGGETEVVGCSAITGEGVDELLETIQTYAELLELKANPKKRARGTVLEAKKDVGKGIVVTCLVEDGTLKKAQPIVCGKTGGKVRRMTDEWGKVLKEAGPGTPVEILGISEVPEAGDRFYAVEKESELKAIVVERTNEALKTASVDGFDHVPSDEQGIWEKLAEQNAKVIRVVIKADVQGSLQVLKRELAALSTSEVRCKVIRDGCGAISTADVLLATASEAVVIGFGVSSDGKARSLARERGIDIRTYRIIYELLDGVKEIMSGVLEPEEREEVIGSVSIRRVFKSSKVGNIGGCFVESGLVRRNNMLRLVRDGIILWQGGMDSLRRFKDDVKEVRENFECGIKLKGYDDIKEGDMLEVVEIQKIARTL